MRKRALYRLLLAFVLAFSGGAAQLHSLAHAQSDLAAAQDHKAPAPLKHSSDRCLVVHALDGTAAEAGVFLLPSDAAHPIFAVVIARVGESPAEAFRSRAPPLPA